jgi:hypothetical protein
VDTTGQAPLTKDGVSVLKEGDEDQPAVVMSASLEHVGEVLTY